MAVKTVEIDNLINDQLYGFRMFPRNLKGQYQTRNDKGTATATPVAFQLPTYTGQHAIFGDINEGRIEMYGSGTLTLSAGTYDIFVVGGGGGGGEGYWKGVAHGHNYIDGGGGGGGGYTTTRNSVTAVGTYLVTIGSGGEIGLNGGETRIGDIAVSNGGFGGEKGTSRKGGDGGSGGGGTSGDGGSDGSDGMTSRGIGGTGQHTTTRAFGESTGTLYAGGGGGGARWYYIGDGDYVSTLVATGGTGGGGNGGRVAEDINDTTTLSTSGKTNTGGGGGGGHSDKYGSSGGSGIAIARWKNN